MSRGGFRAAGFMDGFMSGFDFVDRLQRADEERGYRREREAREDAYRQQVYGLRLRAMEEEQAGSLAANERLQRNPTDLNGDLGSVEERRRIRRENQPSPRLELPMGRPDSGGYFGAGYLGSAWEDYLP